MVKRENIIKWTFVGAVHFAAFFVGVSFFIFKYPLVDFSVLERYDPGKPTLLLDTEGKEWGRFQYDKREPVSIKQMPEHLLYAFVAAEDWAFFDHYGLSWRGIIRSAAINLYHGRIVQGASTITQQLIKMLYFNPKKTFKRKLKEQFFTLLVERHFTKEQILETYLNHVYFGCGIYGVQAVAQRFWGKDVQELSIDQAALLAAIVCSPGNFCPLLFPLSSQNRRNMVLGKMKKLSFITEQQYERAKAATLELRVIDRTALAPHLKETLRMWLEERYGKQTVYSGGLIVRTTLDQKVQKIAEQSFAKQFVNLRQKLGGDVDGALISMDVATGEIRALIGGASFTGSQFNRALQAYRQQGSVFKPVLYATALEQGMSLLDTAIDEPLRVQAGASVWEPRNHTRRFEGEMTLARALSFSNNIISAKTILEVGPRAVINCARRCGITSNMNPYPSLALGCLDSTLAEVTGMFNVFANQGMYVEPHTIKWVKDAWGKKIYRASHKQYRAVDACVAGKISHTLLAGFERKRKHTKKWINSQAINKTGTTNDSRTCWFAGSTPDLTTVIYVGCDDNRPMGQTVYPLHTAYPIWIAMHKKIVSQKTAFSFDASLRPVFVNWKTGKIVAQQTGNDVHPLLV